LNKLNLSREAFITGQSICDTLLHNPLEQYVAYNEYSKAEVRFIEKGQLGYNLALQSSKTN